MNYYATAKTDTGTRKNVNQDALMVQNQITGIGNLCICVICDGMGGLSSGEIASTCVIDELIEWFNYRANVLHDFNKITFELCMELERISKKINLYGRENDIEIGTTASVLLMCEKQYAILHIGDTRIYEISTNIFTKLKRLTMDQSINNYMLTQALGMNDAIKPQIVRGRLRKNNIYILCSDGFRNKNSDRDFRLGFCSRKIRNMGILEETIEKYIKRARDLGEIDDISVIGIKVV